MVDYIVIQKRKVKVMTTSRAGGLHKPPWGISHAEPIGSSNYPPLAEVAPLPQMWLLFSASLVQREVARLAVTEGLFFADFSTSTTPQSASLTAPLTQGSLPLRRKLCKAKAFWNHQHCWWFSFHNKAQRFPCVKGGFFVFYSATLTDTLIYGTGGRAEW